MKSSQFLSIPSSSSQGGRLSQCFNDPSILFHHSIDLNTTSRVIQKLGESPGSDYVIVGDINEVNENGSSRKNENLDGGSINSCTLTNRNVPESSREHPNPSNSHKTIAPNLHTWNSPCRNGNSRTGLSSYSFSGASNSKPTDPVSKEFKYTDSPIRLGLGQSISHKFSNLFHNSNASQNSSNSPASKRQSNVANKNFLSTITTLSQSGPSSTSTVTSSGTSSSNENVENVQSRLRSIWNNVRYGWTVQMNSNFDLHSPICLLGVIYDFTSSTNADHRFLDDHGNTFNPQVKRFYRDFASRLWFTYRHGFPLLPCSSRLSSHSSTSPTPKKGIAASIGLSLGVSLARRNSLESDRSISPTLPSPNNTMRTSDSGWGCMLRCGQMLMAQALILHFLLRSWRVKESDLKPSLSHPPTPSTVTSADSEKDMHRIIIRWFGDCSSTSSPFSIHNLLNLSGKEAGDWFGPASVCELLRKALHLGQSHNDLLQQVDTYVAMDRQIYVKDIRSLFCTQQNHHLRVTLDDLNDTIDTCESCCSRAVILLIPLYLGNIKGFQEEYFATPLLEMFRDSRFVGLIGGRPRHSLYFLGFQDRELIYLDPHLTQAVVDMTSDSFLTETFHCKHPRKMHLGRIDPSCAVGFYCRSPKDLYFLLCNITRLRSKNASAFPLIEILSGERPKYSDYPEPCSEIPKFSSSHSSYQSFNHHIQNGKSERQAVEYSVEAMEPHKDNEFVLL